MSKKILFLNSAPIIKYGMEIGFKRCGWETRHLLFTKEINEFNSEDFLRVYQEFRPDYVFMEGGINAHTWVFPVLEQTQAKLIYWGIEDPVSMGHRELSHIWAEQAHLVVTPCIEAIPKYHQWGHHDALCIPFAIDPGMHNTRGYDKHFSELDAIIIANNYEYYTDRRIAYRNVIQPFIDKQMNMEIHGGKEWVDRNCSYHVADTPDIYKGYMPMETSVIAYSNAKFVLGVHSVVTSKTMQSMRTFEVLGCGGFFLTSATPAIQHMFRNHEHLIWTGSYDETVSLIDYYKDRPDARQKIAEQGQKFVYEHHTYEQRARKIIVALDDKACPTWT